MSSIVSNIIIELNNNTTGEQNKKNRDVVWDISPDSTLLGVNRYLNNKPFCPIRSTFPAILDFEVNFQLCGEFSQFSCGMYSNQPSFLFLLALVVSVPVGQHSGDQLAITTLVATINISFFTNFFFSIATFSHRRSARIKKLI